MQFTGASLILLDLITWFDGDLTGTNSFWVGAGLLSAGSLIAPNEKKEESFTSESIDIGEIDFKVIYKEHAGQLWRYTSLPDVLTGKGMENHEAVIPASVAKYAFRQVVVEEGSPEWEKYYRDKEQKIRQREERRRK